METGTGEIFFFLLNNPSPVFQTFYNEEKLDTFYKQTVIV